MFCEYWAAKGVCVHDILKGLHQANIDRTRSRAIFSAKWICLYSDAPHHKQRAIRPGDLCSITNLVRRCELNGLRGIVRKRIEDGRLEAKTELQTLFSIRPESLQVTLCPAKTWVCKDCKADAYWSDRHGE